VTIAPSKQRLRGVVGESAPRVDASPKVKGEFLYGSDLAREGMLYGATLRSPHAHASTSRAHAECRGCAR
jgi:CO/xanthine dehydrogenase Mo-binding subunit